MVGSVNISGGITTTGLKQTGLYITYFDLDLRSKITSQWAYTKKVLLLHPLDADIYPISYQGRHSVQGEFHINRYDNRSGAAGITIKVDSCAGYSSTWGIVPSMTVLNSGENAITSANLNNEENTVSFCECIYDGIPYRAVYFSGMQVVDYSSFSGKVFNMDENFGRIIEYYKYYKYTQDEPADEILNEEIYESIELKDERYIEQHIQVGSSSIYGDLVIGRKKSAIDGKSGVYINSAGGIEISNATAPYIDFHYANSTEDYTSRISETAKGKLTVSNDLIVNKDLTVSGLTSFSQRPTVNGVQLATVEDIAALRSLLAGGE